MHHGVLVRGLPRHAARTLIGTRSVLRHARTSRSQSPPEVYGIDVMAEQAPSAASRIRLGRRRDRLGMPITVLDWQISDFDLESVRRTIQIFGDHVRAAGVGAVISTMETKKPPPAVFGNWHHMGTTRMHPDPVHGVVDEQCRVHELDNLYIAGGSVFPTGGYANPALTVVALALRLSDHLRSAADSR
jgi:choline dehydrogenase-like flavoprotein